MEYAEEVDVFGKTKLDKIAWLTAALALRNPQACNYDRNRVINYALGKSPPDEAMEVREHIKNCWACLDLVIETLIAERGEQGTS